MTPEKIYYEHVKPVHRYFYYKGVPLSDVEDLVQETFMRFFAKYGTDERAESENRRILYTIAKNVWREWVRSSIRNQTVEFDDLRDIPENTQDFEEETAPEIDKEKLLKALERLNQTLKNVLTLRFIENMTRKEIALKLQIKEKDVHTYQKRGIKQLQKQWNLPVPPPTYT